MSMTGFGRATRIEGDIEILAEIRAVNHRFLDVSVRVPRLYSSLEHRIRQMVSESLGRGKIDVTVGRTGGCGTVVDVWVDYELAGRYHKCLTDLRKRLGLDREISVSDLLTLKDIVLPREHEEGLEDEWPLVERSVRSALDNLDTMRRAEGGVLWKDIEGRLTSITQMADSVAPLVDQVIRNAQERLEKRIQELTGGTGLDPDRLLQEAALIADRSDVTEELTRLKSHVAQFRAFAGEGSPIGRKLDFLLQEIHREVNTLGAKSASTDIASYVVLMKGEVEKIREQVQNIE
jgi:uncharacterized protein (TIGR00255 family)